MKKLLPEIALVVCTKNRAHRLEPFLDSLRRLNYAAPWELIIVDGSTDDSIERLKAFAATFPAKTTIITELGPGHPLARNRGWRASTAPVIAFIDDDCYPAPDYLSDVLAGFADGSLGFIGGRILLHDPTDARITIAESQTETFLDPGVFVPCGFLQGANMAFRRQVLDNINGFDDHLGGGNLFGCEDGDAVLRALAGGWKGKYDPKPVVYHHPRRKPGKDVVQLKRKYEGARGAYYMKCILYMPQRWHCLKYVWNNLPRQGPGQTVREFYWAICYFFHQLLNRPNISH
jgi:glycosyltransferase involved in cell wall biosynthesis